MSNKNRKGAHTPKWELRGAELWFPCHACEVRDNGAAGPPEAAFCTVFLCLSLAPFLWKQQLQCLKRFLILFLEK